MDLAAVRTHDISAQRNFTIFLTYKATFNVTLNADLIDYVEDVKRCPNNCNGFGTCELETGTCFCPGFKGANCGKCYKS